MVAQTDAVRSVSEAEGRKVSTVDLAQGERAILAAGRLGNFRASYGARSMLEDGSIGIDSATADLLDVSPGDTGWSGARGTRKHGGEAGRERGCTYVQNWVGGGQ